MWCRSRDLEVTRSGAYKKNDQAFVEQKNGAVVRFPSRFWLRCAKRRLSSANALTSVLELSLQP
jgi:hypothetical protein